MNLRRLYRHVKDHDWFAVFVDFVIVVAGVFVGIQVSNWNADRIQRREARTYVERIRDDIAVSAQTIGNMVTYYRRVKVHALAALDAFGRPPSDLGQQFLIDAFQSSQILMRTVERSAYDEILATGAMNSIPDVSVRVRISSYYKNVAAIEDLMRFVPPYRENLRRTMPYPVLAAMFEHCDDVPSVDARGTATAVLPERCDPGLQPATVSAAVAAIYTPDLELDLNRRLADLDTKLTNYQRLIDRGESLDKFLAEAKF